MPINYHSTQKEASKALMTELIFHPPPPAYLCINPKPKTMKKHLTALLLVMLSLPTFAGDIAKPGYIINLSGDTLRGKILLHETKKGYYDLIEVFVSIKFQDSSGSAVSYQPGQIQGFGYTMGSDSSYIHFRSFADVEMKGTFGVKKENVFLLRECSGIIDVFYLYHKNEAFIQSSRSPEVYIISHHDSSSGKLTWIPYDKIKFGSNQLIYRKTTITPYLKDWPEDNLNEVPKEMTIPTLFMVFSSYNLWWYLQHKL